ncbi:meiotic recombination protein REC114-like [Acropora muricata]|uniref:meiotic recombination protein REC114-like n=1 Tax=Acropora muricata TaxID=159855 RepID=UPI0034E523C0
MLCETQRVKSWPLEKYAKFIATDEAQSSQKHNQGYWKQFLPTTDASSCLQLSLLQCNIVVSEGKVIHENISLFNAKKWMQAVVKGDSMLIIYKINSNCRRFRVKFSKSNGRSAVDNCRQVIAEISPHIHVREVSTACGAETDSQAQMDVDSQLVSPESQNTQGNAATVRSTTSNSIPSSDAKGLTVSDLARKVSTSESRDFANQCIGHVGVPQDRLNLLIRLCLTDSNFPAFVEAVEKELTSLTSSENDE